jgi:hypothetical protein
MESLNCEGTRVVSWEVTQRTQGCLQEQEQEQEQEQGGHYIPRYRLIAISVISEAE